MFEIHRSSDCLYLRGDVTILHLFELKAALEASLAEAPASVIDLSRVRSLDLAGVQLLLWLNKRCRESGGPPDFVGHSPAVIEAFDRMDHDAIYTVTAAAHPLG